MTEFIRNTPELILIPIILTAIFYFRLVYLGMKYDDAMLKINPRYKGYNFIRIHYWRITIPHKQLDYTKNLSVDKYARKFNRLLIVFWITIVLIFAFWFIQNT